MKKVLLVLLVVVLVLTGCASGGSVNVRPQEKPDYLTGTPWLASNIDGVVTEDTPSELKVPSMMRASDEARFSLLHNTN